MSDGLHDSKPTYYIGMSTVRPGKMYRHFKGALYVVISVAWDSGDYDNADNRIVTYMDLDTGKIAYRDLLEFILPKIHEGGRKEERFVYCGDARITITPQGKYEVTRTY